MRVRVIPGFFRACSLLGDKAANPNRTRTCVRIDARAGVKAEMPIRNALRVNPLAEVDCKAHRGGWASMK